MYIHSKLNHDEVLNWRFEDHNGLVFKTGMMKYHESSWNKIFNYLVSRRRR